MWSKFWFRAADFDWPVADNICNSACCLRLSMEQCSFSTILKKSSKYQVLCSCVDDYMLSLLMYIYMYIYSVYVWHLYVHTVLGHVPTDINLQIVRCKSLLYSQMRKNWWMTWVDARFDESRRFMMAHNTDCCCCCCCWCDLLLTALAGWLSPQLTACRQ